MEAGKRAAAARALELVQSGMKLGLGTGSTAHEFVALLGERVAAGLDVVGVPTSQRTAAHAASLGIRITTLDELPELDLTIDGADEFDPALNLVKGGGGALLREKIVATASKRMVVITDSSKQVQHLGRFPLPVEVNRFGLGATRNAIVRVAELCGCHGEIALRRTPEGADYLTDGGHLIFDCHFGRIDDPAVLADRLVAIPGVVEHGLFIGIASQVICAGPDGIAVLDRAGAP
ncbi:Ribose-5-phosphate isomerase A [Beijerinckiaceae bacterium RH AL1]|nr:ribose-5-phosphate isomerase RpiA [Beijerinckiaceae bacterium]VVB45443.1 Ribose-5-phosphate isomerase A [Beijerinckiaceae bacterium RH CH11]VVB45520.1 Ribose-5-phosphate isomerase A [Beijerinckiaceae bacterium RH AL8]VVC54868.1 Ribose-5-phosphate isomerase A [Beijerinckiaceae bacterium RH AL1]